MYTIDDIAISNTLAAVTTHETARFDTAIVTPYTQGRVWFIDMPEFHNVPLVSCAMRYVDVPYAVTPPFLVREAESNSFVTAANGVASLYMSGFIGSAHHATATLPSAWQLRNICYNPLSRSTEVVTKNQFPYTYGNTVFSILPGMAYTAGTTYGYKFGNCNLHSLDYLTYNHDNFAGVGFDGETKTLTLVQYHYNYSLACSTNPTEKTGLLEWHKAAKEGSKYITDIYYAPSMALADIEKRKARTICLKRITENQ